MLFENGHARFLEAHRDGDVPDASIGVKIVDEPSHYGVVELDDGRVQRLVEKPDEPPSDLAISGVYVVEDSPSLFAALEHIVENDLRGAGNEYQLTDALQRMVDDGGNLATFEVEDWYDCGRPDTLLEANRVLLQAQDADPSDRVDDSVVVPPVDVGDDVTVSNSVVGPHVSVDDGARIEGSIVADAIVGRNASLERINLEESILGDNAEVVGQPTHLNLGDNSTIDL
jgi:glucose-1-phosphate thymidylyltransferase